MTIACIGWGSLVWNPRELPIMGSWRYDGPMLPVEFARQSADGRMTLVIYPGAPKVRTCWTLLDVPDIASAKTALASREFKRDAGAAWIKKNIGFCDRGAATAYGLEAGPISAWAETHDLAGVVWTNLSAKFRGDDNAKPSGDEVIAHLRGLKDTARAGAEEYVRKAPAQIDTPYRRLMAEQLGWTPLPP